MDRVAVWIGLDGMAGCLLRLGCLFKVCVWVECTADQQYRQRGFLGLRHKGGVPCACLHRHGTDSVVVRGIRASLPEVACVLAL